MKRRLNKFHLCLLFSFLLSTFNNFAHCAISQSLDFIEFSLSPKTVYVGDTLSVKVTKIKDEKQSPKIFFDKTKYPAFSLSGKYYRSLIPLSANFKSGKYVLEIYYKGKVKRADLVVNETTYPLETLTLSKEVAALRASKTERALVGKALSEQSSEKLWSGKFIFPSDAPMSTVYGVKRKTNGVIDPDYFHKGLDFAGSLGSDVVSPENGKVILAGHNSMGFVVNGNCLFIDHGHGVVTGYLHLSSILVKEGDFVKRGQLIGKVGSSGIASGPHLHWGLYVLGKTVDPIKWINTTIE